MSSCCFIVPPYLLRGIADSTDNPDRIRKEAQESLAARDDVTKSRQEYIRKITQPRAVDSAEPTFRASPFIPESLLKHLSASEAVDETTRTQAKRDLKQLQVLEPNIPAAQKGLAADGQVPKVPRKEASYRSVHDSHNSESYRDLPGKNIRAEGESAVKDKDVNQAFDNVGHVLDFYKEYFKWDSIDGQNADIISSVHFGRHFQNAFWINDPKLGLKQMVFGDGADFLRNFTNCIDVIGHELAHAVTEYTSPLAYENQSGALNEHVSDVFGIMVKQKIEKETADKADWLIGEYCILPDVKGIALRSMKSPGTAFDDPRFGKDPQVDNMAQFEVVTKDAGGVHIYSGIPNKAFFLTAVAFGGFSWEKAGQIWWKAMTCNRVPVMCNFTQFADVTVECAEELFGAQAAKTVRKAWNEVGVTRRI